MKSIGFRLAALVMAGTVVVLGWTIFDRLRERQVPGGRDGGARPAPVEVAPVERGPMELRRTFSGTLEALEDFAVAPKVSGRVERMLVDLADTVRQGQVVAELDDDEYVQAVREAKADLAVARANLAEARSALEIAERELRRIETLRKRGVMSDAQLDTAKASELAKRAQLEVAKARTAKAEASLEAANIRLGYTRVTAGWTGDDKERVVAERFVNEGDTVSANAPLLSIVDLDPVAGVIYATEKDYARLRPGQPVLLSADAYPGEGFPGRVDRIAPVFQKATRQAKVQLTVDNEDHRLKPGMFVRATVVLDRVESALVVPQRALTTREDRTGVFVVREDGRSVAWRQVKTGIRDGERVQVEGEGLSGLVVTLGQQLLDDGSPIAIPGEEKGPSASADREMKAP